MDGIAGVGLGAETDSELPDVSPTIYLIEYTPSQRQMFRPGWHIHLRYL